MSGSAEALRDDPPGPQPEYSPSLLFVPVLLDQEAAAFGHPTNGPLYFPFG